MAEALAAEEAGTYFFHTAWFGGRPLGDFASGGVTFANLVDAADGAVRLLRQRQLGAEVSALVLIQGEAGPPDRATYAALLDEVLDDTLAALRSTTGQAAGPTAILVQTSTSNANPTFAADVGLAQWDVAARRNDTILAGPTYQLPVADKVHHSAEGRMMLGEMLALAYEARVIRGAPFTPLHPVGVSARVPASLSISRGRRGSLPLAFDENWVAPAPNRGFLVVGRKPLDIADVSITGPNQVTLRLEADPGGPVTVRYAMTPSPREGWAPMRGQLSAPTLHRSHFAGRGFRVPAMLAHYAIRFALRTD